MSKMGYTPPFLDVRKVAGAYNVYAPSSTSTDDLTIFPNTTDATAYLSLQGLGHADIAHGATKNFRVFDGTTQYLWYSYTSPDVNMLAANNKNIFLVTSGTGNVKFGTYTAGAATDSTGYITILDAAGNTRKLMVQA